MCVIREISSEWYGKLKTVHLVLMREQFCGENVF